jgi:hypothetical protein
MPHTELESFIATAKTRGAADDFLASLLIRKGWPPDDVYGALADWWERDTGIAVPSRRTKVENARDAFLYLLAFSTLGTWAFALGSLCFRLIEYWLPDRAISPYSNYLRATVTWQIASILVALPVYLVVMRLILRETRANPDALRSGVCKWLTYLALLLAAVGVVSDLVCFVDTFLKGELTVRFVLKCAVVLGICGSIFRYYFGFLNGRAGSRTFGVLAVAGATLAVCLGMSVTGTPRLQRRIEADNRRVEDLRTIANVLASSASLPASMDELTANRPFLSVTDPETRQRYEYRRKSTSEYELCANFAAAAARSSYGTGFWSHPPGRACFAVDRTRPVPW